MRLLHQAPCHVNPEGLWLAAMLPWGIGMDMEPVKEPLFGIVEKFSPFRVLQ